MGLTDNGRYGKHADLPITPGLASDRLRCHSQSSFFLPLPPGKGQLQLPKVHDEIILRVSQKLFPVLAWRKLHVELHDQLCECDAEVHEC